MVQPTETAIHNTHSAPVLATPPLICIYFVGCDCAGNQPNCSIIPRRSMLSQIS
jgi:hypothetical protein